MKELNLPLLLPQDVSTRYRSVDMTVLASFVLHRPVLLPPLQPWFVKKTAFFSAKAKSSRILQSRILGEFAGSRLGTWHAVSEFSVSWIRGLWLEAFGKAGLFGYQSVFCPRGGGGQAGKNIV